MDFLQGTLKKDFTSVAGVEETASFDFHQALAQRAETNIPDEWKNNPEGYNRIFVDTAVDHMLAQDDTYREKGLVFGADEQLDIISRMPADLDDLQYETYSLRRELSPETRERRDMIDSTTSDLSRASQYDELGVDQFENPSQVEAQIDIILGQSSAFSKSYDFDPEQEFAKRFGKDLSENTKVQLQEKMGEVPENIIPSGAHNIPANTM